MTLTTEWNIPDALDPFYLELQGMGFVNTTAPTPAEWELPGTMQVILEHVARETTIRYRAVPPAPPEPIHSVEGQIRYDKGFPWSERKKTQDCSLQEFRAWLLMVSRLIETQVRAGQVQSRL
jgi:hypothetical protein